MSYLYGGHWTFFEKSFFLMSSAFLMIFAPLNPYKMDVYSILN